LVFVRTWCKIGKTPADYMTEFIPAPPSDDDEDVSVTEDAGELMEFEQ
jgi:hypothetical protein